MDESTDESDCSREETMLSESDQLARQAKLGFKPQKELWCNLRLPYADRLDDESQELLKLIKSNFVKALVHKEMNPGFYISATQLSWYVMPPRIGQMNSLVNNTAMTASFTIPVISNYTD